MIVILKQNPDKEQLENLISWLEDKNIRINKSVGETHTILGLIGDTSQIDIGLISALDIVEQVRRIQEPFKKANRKFHPKDTVIDVKGSKIGDGSLAMIAGPCSVESEEQIFSIAHSVKESGATMLRGGTFKPRTSPYSFQGLHEEGVKLLVAAGKEVGLPVVSEIMDISQLDCFSDVDICQVGARNMQNFELLKELGKTDKPILLKRGLSATFEELLMSAEYIMSQGNENIILCERGIRTFETAYRNTLDVAAVPVLKELSHLPVVIDPSHAAGKISLIPSLSYASVAAGADGLLVEVHNDPPHALSDAAQQLRPEEFDALNRKCQKIKKIISED